MTATTSRMLCTLILCHLLISGAACSHQAARSDGGASTNALPLQGVERIAPEPLLSREDPSPAAVRRQVELRREQAMTAAAGLRDVWFAYDSWDLSEDAMQALTADANWLLAHSSAGVRIEGHCDQRGSAAYNLVLGEKRAVAVREYLTDLGVPAERLTVMSYGEAQPLCHAATESCYRDNRRGHLVVTP
jgi:peptidoglycan-associated lipoprotein